MVRSKTLDVPVNPRWQSDFLPQAAEKAKSADLAQSWRPRGPQKMNMGKINQRNGGVSDASTSTGERTKLDRFSFDPRKSMDTYIKSDFQEEISH